MIKYSIIVPAHNSAAFISKCLESVTQQTYRNYELIVVCDSCNDNTDRIAYQYADGILYVDYGNDGLARQAGIDVARGEWILFLDDDDWWMNEYVLSMIDEALDSIEDEIDMLCFGFIFKGKGYAAPLRYGASGQMQFWPAVWNKCYRHEFIRGIKFQGIKITADGAAPDRDWTERLLQQNPRIKCLDHALYYYNYMRIGSQTYSLEVNK